MILVRRESENKNKGSVQVQMIDFSLKKNPSYSNTYKIDEKVMIRNQSNFLKEYNKG